MGREIPHAPDDIEAGVLTCPRPRCHAAAEHAGQLAAHLVEDHLVNASAAMLEARAALPTTPAPEALPPTAPPVEAGSAARLAGATTPEKETGMPRGRPTCSTCNKPGHTKRRCPTAGAAAGAKAAAAPSRNGRVASPVPPTTAATRAVLAALADKLERDAEAMKSEAATIRRVAERVGA